jgi:hypothetical protein
MTADFYSSSIFIILFLCVLRTNNRQIEEGYTRRGDDNVLS